MEEDTIYVNGVSYAGRTATERILGVYELFGAEEEGGKILSELGEKIIELFALGNGSLPRPKEREFLNRWIAKVGRELVEVACEKAYQYEHKYKLELKVVENILRGWEEVGINDAEDARIIPWQALSCKRRIAISNLEGLTYQEWQDVKTHIDKRFEELISKATKEQIITIDKEQLSHDSGWWWSSIDKLIDNKN